MIDWIADDADTGTRWEPWKTVPGFEYSDGNVAQHWWRNLATGARMVLIADGTHGRPHDARFRLWARYPGDGDVELTHLLTHNVLNDGRYLTGPNLTGSSLYRPVEKSCVDYVNTLLGLTPAQPAAPAGDDEAVQQPSLRDTVMQRLFG